MKKVFTGKIPNMEEHQKDTFMSNLAIEDGGQAMIVDISDDNIDDENGLCMTLTSWDENLQHTEFKKFVGRKVKITIETVD